MPKPVIADTPTEENAEAASISSAQVGMSIEQMTAMQSRASSSRASSRKRKWIGWFLLLIVLIAVGFGGFFGRNYLVQVWSASAKFYQFLRIDVETANMLGLEIHDLKTKSVLQNGVTTLTVTGIIKNITDSPQPLPRIKVALIDKAGQSVYSWTTTVEEPEVAAWGQVEFSTSMNQPPEDAKNVKVDLVELGK
ncbi:MAG: DUF3426 domain-containing protein [Sneathiella sp.]|nr:DUF3426 domain-containing protein [Sneathiella sp.]